MDLRNPAHLTHAVNWSRDSSLRGETHAIALRAGTLGHSVTAGCTFGAATLLVTPSRSERPRG